MVSNPLKAFPLAILLAFPAAAAHSGDGPPEKDKKVQTRVVVTDDGVFSSDGDEPFVIHTGPRSRQGYLGVRLLEMTPELRTHFGAPKDAGVLVAGVEESSPAAKAGIQVGDIITKADGDRIESGGDLTRAVRRMKSGETLKVEVSRDRSVKQLAVKIEERRHPEMDLGDLGRTLGRHPWIMRYGSENLDRLQEKLEDLEKRLKDLEKRLPTR